MIEIVLPYVENNMEFYKILKNLMREKRDYFFTDMKITHLYGNVPWSYWNSNKNTNFNSRKIYLEKHFIYCSNEPK